MPKVRKHADPKPDMARIVAIGQQLRNMANELKLIFPERGDLIDQMIYAILTKEHVLIHGPFGTGKSDLVQTFFRCFEGSKLFSIEMSKFMSESQIIGAPNPKEMRETGAIIYNPELGILLYDFAELDELFDANSPVLRTLLGLLNERMFKRGRQQEKVLLHTAIASTNGDPDEMVRKDPQLGAVVDRFIFHCKIGYLQSRESRIRMYQKFLGGEVPETKIPFEDLKYISTLTTSCCQITDADFIDVYDRALEAFVVDAGCVLSDRRKAKLLQLVEASALLYGRYNVDFEDIKAIRYGLCDGGDVGQMEHFNAITDPILEEARHNQQGEVDKACIQLLEEYRGKIPTDPIDPQADLVALKQKLNKLANDVKDAKPLLPSTEDKQREILIQIAEKQDEVQKRIDGV